jgi:hypothetical protein
VVASGFAVYLDEADATVPRPGDIAVLIAAACRIVGCGRRFLTAFMCSGLARVLAVFAAPARRHPSMACGLHPVLVKAVAWVVSVTARGPRQQSYRPPQRQFFERSGLAQALPARQHR